MKDILGTSSGQGTITGTTGTTARQEQGQGQDFPSSSWECLSIDEQFQ